MTWSRIWDNIRFSLQEMKVNKTRTILSLLGVTIGIFCIIMVRTLVDSLSYNISNSLSSFGSDVVYVSRFAWVPEDNSGEYPFWKYLARPAATYNEYKILQEELEGIQSIALFYNGGAGDISYRGQSAEGISVYGVTQDFGNIQNIDLQQGRFLSSSEAENISPLTVIGSEVYATLGKNPAMLDQYLQVDNRSVRIIGVMKKKGDNMAGFDFDNAILLPYKLTNAMYNFEGTAINSTADPLLMIKAKSQKMLPEVEDNTTAILRRLRQLKPKEENTFSFNRLSTLQKAVDSIFSVINFGGALIGGFALLIGLFGIANIMFVSVKERTPIIGLQKALGAKKVDILIEFLSESILLCLIGGMLGLLLIYIVSLVIQSRSDFNIFLSAQNINIGMLISLAVGFLAGIIPANSAANMKPVDAIRYS